MARFVRRSTKKIGQMPGTAEYVGDAREHSVSIDAFEYDAEDVVRTYPTTEQELATLRDSPRCAWINVDGVHDVDTVQRIADVFDLHPLAVEDIVHTGQRPKLDEYAGHLYIVLRMLRWDERTQQVDDEQVSMIVGPTWVLSFQERQGDVFNPIRERIQTNRGRVRKLGADYLSYALLDAVVDHYFAVLEELGDQIEAMGEEMARDPKPEELDAIRRLKRELLFVRKSVWPTRELLSALQRDENPLLTESVRPYLRDVYDHTIQTIDTVETFRDMLSSLTDLYMTSVSNRMNEVMKVLTIIATIFIPLSFVAGVYGMNFTFMPELGWKYGYFCVLGLMFCMAAAMVVYFKRKRWM